MFQLLQLCPNKMELYKTLDANIQSKIRVFVLGFGTPEANLLKNLFSKINQKKKEYHMYPGIEDLTVWRYFILEKSIQEITFQFSGWNWFNVYDDLQLALLESPLSETSLFDMDPASKNMQIEESRQELQILFKRKLNVVLSRCLYQTPTAKIIHSVVERNYQYAGRTSESDINTLWSIRIWNRYNNRPNKLNVPHAELQRAYNSIQQFTHGRI